MQEQDTKLNGRISLGTWLTQLLNGERSQEIHEFGSNFLDSYETAKFLGFLICDRHYDITTDEREPLARAMLEYLRKYRRHDEDVVTLFAQALRAISMEKIVAPLPDSVLREFNDEAAEPLQVLSFAIHHATEEEGAVLPV